MSKFPVFIQHDVNDCGPACLRMIARYYGKHYTLESLREKSFISRDGVSLLGISEAAEEIGFRSKGLKISFDQLKNDVIHPCVVHWKQEHFVLVYQIKKGKVYVADPAFGKIVYNENS
ncbi:Lactococcin-G-processing and transport ATP-binding protein LagD [subsurface metagenome]